ncbi:MAG: AAA family ATPase [Notoacmeibacter sp.]|nr:AAA family ATPase [Notoacmeibacter sp.]
MAELKRTSNDEAKGRKVPLERLRRRTDPAAFTFATTAELEPVSGLIGQDRALSAIRFGTSIAQPSFHIFALGPSGVGKATAVRQFLEERAAGEPPPLDWVFVNNFDTPHKPIAISLPSGRAKAFSQALIEAVDELRSALPAVFESEGYQSRRQAIDDEIQGSQESAFSQLNKESEASNIAILRTPVGFAMAPARNGKVIPPEEFHALPENERKAIEERIADLQKQLEEILKRIPHLEKERRLKIHALNDELATIAVESALDSLEAAFADITAVNEHLAKVRRDLIANAELFLGEGQDGPDSRRDIDTAHDARFRRYMVNTIISREEEDGAPIVEEANPTLGNLVGRIEHLSQMGALVTDFLLIKPGALHRANGGYLLLDARKVLLQPFSWEALKRALKNGQITIESPAEQLSLVSTVSLEPDRIPLGVRCVLFGDRQLYYLLCALDPEFPDLFKVAADFDDEFERSDGNGVLYARLIASIAHARELRPIDAGAVARLIDEGSRIAGDSERLTLQVEELSDLISEADFWAGEAGRDTIAADDVDRALRERIHRQDRLRQKAQESIAREIRLIDTQGMAVGQINGLSVLQLGQFAFGQPSRITARTRMGTGKVVDIEREVELGGPFHSKGVMILRGFLEGRYALKYPLSLSASLVFEQSYGGVDGDSASSAELYALLSALSGVPIRQSIAVTGSVNQHGVVQAIGGVNEKIEGFFDVCNKRGFTGDQGVIIPKANLVHLMLREDVVEAVRQQKFHVYAVETIDQGIEILTGLPAGERGPDNAFPDGTINRKVEDCLIGYAETRREFGKTEDNNKQGNGKP